MRQVERGKQKREDGVGRSRAEWFKFPPLSAERQWDEKREQRQTLPGMCRARSLARSGNCGLGSEAGKGVPTPPGRTRLLGSPAIGGSLRYTLIVAVRSRAADRWDEAGVVRQVLAAASSRGAERRDSQSRKVQAVRRRGAPARAAGRGAAARRLRDAATGATSTARHPPPDPVKSTCRSAAATVRYVSANRGEGLFCPRPAQLSVKDSRLRDKREALRHSRAKDCGS